MSLRAGASLVSVVGILVAFGGCGGSSTASSASSEDSGASDGGADGSSGAPDSGGYVATCADTSADPKNCGACGHDCLGGTCASGTCESFSLATATTIEWLDVDETFFLYIGTVLDGNPNGGPDCGTGLGCKPILRGGLEGAAPVQIGRALDGANAGTTTKSVIGVEPGGVFIYFAKDGSSKGMLGPDVLAVGNAAMVAGNGFFAAAFVATDGLHIVNEQNNAASVFTSSSASPYQLLFGGGNLYAISTSSKINTIPLPPPANSPLPAGQTMGFVPKRCAISGTSLVCATPDKIVSVPLDTPTAAPTTILTTTVLPYPGVSYPRAFAADAANVYWYDAGSGALVSCSVAGCTAPRTIAPQVGNATLVALNSKLVVYYDSTKAEIRAVAK